MVVEPAENKNGRQADDGPNRLPLEKIIGRVADFLRATDFLGKFGAGRIDHQQAKQRQADHKADQDPIHALIGAGGHF